jgi:hypothetical protein
LKNQTLHLTVFPGHSSVSSWNRISKVSGRNRPRKGSRGLLIPFTSGAMAVKLDMISEQGKIPCQFSWQIDDDPLGNVHDLAAQNANEVVMAARIRVVALSCGINGEFSQRTCLRERIERIIDRRKRQGQVFFRHGPVDVLRRGVRGVSFQIVHDREPLRRALELGPRLPFLKMFCIHFI